MHNNIAPPPLNTIIYVNQGTGLWYPKGCCGRLRSSMLTAHWQLMWRTRPAYSMTAFSCRGLMAPAEVQRRFHAHFTVDILLWTKKPHKIVSRPNQRERKNPKNTVTEGLHPESISKCVPRYVRCVGMTKGNSPFRARLENQDHRHSGAVHSSALAQPPPARNLTPARGG